MEIKTKFNVGEKVYIREKNGTLWARINRIEASETLGFGHVVVRYWVSFGGSYSACYSESELHAAAEEATKLCCLNLFEKCISEQEKHDIAECAGEEHRP